MTKKKRAKQSKTPQPQRYAQKPSRVRRFSGWLSRHLYSILYLAILIVLWTYILINWEKCITMQFFSQFDGNNILFLVGIVLVILPFYDLEGKGVKLRRRGTRDAINQMQELDLAFQLEKRKERIDSTHTETLTTPNGGDKHE